MKFVACLVLLALTGCGTYSGPRSSPSRQPEINLGIIGQDARWADYGKYLAELAEIVQSQWHRILEEGRIAPPRGSHVEITFKIDSKGETEIVKVVDSGSGKQGVWPCQNAIESRQPYKPWPAKMIAALGDEQTIVFAFYYQ